MSGVMNTTGAVSGVLGTTVGRTSGEVLNVKREWLSSDTGVWGVHGTSDGQDWTTFWSPTYTTTSSVACKVYATLEVWIKVWANAVKDNYINFRYTIAGGQVTTGTGSNIWSNYLIGQWNKASSTYWSYPAGRILFALREVECSSTNGTITYTLVAQNPNAANGNCGWVIYGDGAGNATHETAILFTEVRA